MKSICVIILMMCGSHLFAQANADEIVGKWMKLPKQDLIIEVYKSGEVYNGKIQWVKAGDTAKNIGFLILENLTYNEEKASWEAGKIHDPRSGKQYKAAAELKSDGILEVLGYKGFKFIGSTKTFKRVN